MPNIEKTGLGKKKQTMASIQREEAEQEFMNKSLPNVVFIAQ